MVLLGLGDRVTHIAQVFEIEIDGAPGILERLVLAPAMRYASRQIGDLCHEYLVFYKPRYKDLVTMHQFDFPSCSFMMAVHRQLSST